MRSDRLHVRPFAIACIVTTAACAGTLDDPTQFTSAGATTHQDAGACGDVEALVAMRCATSGCHAATSPSASLDLATPGVLARLAGKPASGGGTLLVPGDPSTSVLYLKLTARPPFGARMPYGSSLDDASTACIHDWIAADH